MLNNLEQVWAFYRMLPRGRLFLTLFGGFLASASILVGIVSPLWVRDFIDSLGSTNIIPWAIVQKLIILYGLSLVVTYLGELIYNRNKALAAESLRDRIFRESMYLPLKRVKEKGGAYFAELIANQVNSSFIVLDYGFIRNLVYLIRMFYVLLAVLAWDRVLFVLFALNTVIVLSYSTAIDRLTRADWRRLLELARQINAYVVESFSNLHEIWSGENVKARSNDHKARLSDITSVVVRTESKRVTLDRLLIDLPRYASQVGVLLYCGHSIVSGSMTLGTLWVVWSYLDYVISPVFILRDFGQVAVQSGAIIESVRSHLAEAQRAHEGLDESPLDFTQQTVYDVRDVSVRFGQETILDKVSFSVQKGQIVGIVGLSGEGKSTLLNVLLGIDRDYDGGIHLFGREMRTLSPEIIFGSVGYYSQMVGIFNDTLERNISLGREMDPVKMERVVSQVGVDHLRGRPLGEAGSFVSGGERQRIQLARLLYGDKPVAVIDEPLTNLDPINEGFLLERLASFLNGRSAVIISHKPEVLRLSTHLLVLNQGRVTEFGPFAEVSRTSETYRRIITTYLDGARRIDQEYRNHAGTPFTR